MTKNQAYMEALDSARVLHPSKTIQNSVLGLGVGLGCLGLVNLLA